MSMFLFLKEGTKGIKQKPYKTKSGNYHTAEKSRTQIHFLNSLPKIMLEWSHLSGMDCVN